MYKKHPDWLIKKVGQSQKNAEADADAAGSAAAGGEDEISLKKKKKVKEMIENNVEIDALDATDLDINSQEISK